jgi:hypothetical protein
LIERVRMSALCQKRTSGSGVEHRRGPASRVPSHFGAGAPAFLSAPRSAIQGRSQSSCQPRQAWDYGHTFVVFGRVGEAPSKKNVAGLSPKGDDPQMWLMGHYVPVPSGTGWTDGDLEDRYITSRYRVLVSKEQYDRTVAFIRQLQAKSTTWSVELYNCNAFVADIANFMGLKVPSSSWIYPKVFVTNMRKINTGHPEAANELVSENVKEMSNPTRDGRAMINAGLIRPDSAPAGSASPPHVTIGAVRVSNRPASSPGSAQHSPQSE